MEAFPWDFLPGGQLADHRCDGRARTAGSPTPGGVGAQAAFGSSVGQGFSRSVVRRAGAAAPGGPPGGAGPAAWAAAGLGRGRAGLLQPAQSTVAAAGDGVGARFFCSPPSPNSASLRQPRQDQGGLPVFRSCKGEHASRLERTLPSLQPPGRAVSGGLGGAGHHQPELQRSSGDRAIGSHWRWKIQASGPLSA